MNEHFDLEYDGVKRWWPTPEEVRRAAIQLSWARLTDPATFPSWTDVPEEFKRQWKDTK